MSLKTVVRETLSGFKSLLTGLRITAREADNVLAADCDLIDDGDGENNSCAGV